jgi:hypothetical protein
LTENSCDLTSYELCMYNAEPLLGVCASWDRTPLEIGGPGFAVLVISGLGMCHFLSGWRLAVGSLLPFPCL